jgi:hypothetical protein
MLNSINSVRDLLWTRDRTRGMDKRTRGYKKWAERRAAFAARLGREPSVTENELLDALADVAIERDLLRSRRQAGKRVSVITMRAMTSESRRLMMALGLAARVAVPEQSGRSLGALLDTDGL